MRRRLRAVDSKELDLDAEEQHILRRPLVQPRQRLPVLLADFG